MKDLCSESVCRKNLTIDCNFGELRDSLIRDQIVIGVFEHKLQERLLRESNLTLPKAVEICQAAESMQQRIKMINADRAKTVDSIVREKTHNTYSNKSHDLYGSAAKSKLQHRPSAASGKNIHSIEETYSDEIEEYDHYGQIKPSQEEKFFIVVLSNNHQRTTMIGLHRLKLVVR